MGEVINLHDEGGDLETVVRKLLDDEHGKPIDVAVVVITDNNVVKTQRLIVTARGSRPFTLLGALDYLKDQIVETIGWEEG